MKIALVVGHNARAQGAVRVTDKRTEYDWNGMLAQAIHDIDPDAVRIFHRKPEGGYSSEIRRVYAEVDAWGADCSLELHFNAFRESSTGCETLSSGTAGSMVLAGLVQRYTLDAMPMADRGIKVVRRGDRGGLSLWSGRAPAILTEPYFGSNPRDCNVADDHFAMLAEATYQAAREFCAR